MQVKVDPNNYEFIPAQKETDYYDNDVNQRVGIYVRVSTDDVRQTTSFELQKKYYEDFVTKHPNWTLVKIYADEGISGTSLDHRVGFNEMISDAKSGKLDMIITKHGRLGHITCRRHPENALFPDRGQHLRRGGDSGTGSGLSLIHI